MATLQQLLARLIPHPTSDLPPLPQPDPALWLIGDIHGRADLLDRLLGLVRVTTPAPRLIFAGDYIDRGPASAPVLVRLQELVRDEAAICLMGNHERMLLDALDQPAEAALRWLRNGGDATLASFGISGRLPGASEAERLAGMAEALRQALPPGTEAWLRDLPLYWQDGGLAVVHGGADPTLPMADQPEDALLWGHRDFHKPRKDGLWIAHGHVVVAEPNAAAGRIALDTGAWATGRLTAARIGADGVMFLQT